MGHPVSGKSHLVPLIDRLNRYPVGLVDNEKLREILALLFSEEEASMAARFPLTEATSQQGSDVHPHPQGEGGLMPMAAAA